MASGSSRDPGAGASPGHNLPAPLTSLLGRDRELEGIGRGLRKCRLVTLSGPGGVGKTQLALEVARREVGRRAAGVWLVDLALVPGAPEVAAETARTLDIRSRGGVSWTDTLVKYVADRDPLLVLDNCEHVVEDSARLADTLLAACPDARIIATSREVLGLRGERVWRLEPLGIDDARRLFVERARDRRPDFIPDERAEQAIAQLCERLDRLPLAIELAAARVAVMSPQEILASLESRSGELTGGRLAPERHRTVRAAVEWSHQLLDAAEQEALRQLAVFVGGFDADAAVSVAPGLSLDLLARLIDKSLVSVSASPGGRTRYRLLETVREYELGLLERAGELDTARERHLGHFLGTAGDAGIGWPSAAARRIVADLGDDYENLRAALEWCAASKPCAGMGMLAATWDVFFTLGQADGLRLCEALLEHCPAQNRTRVCVQISAGVLRLMQADAGGASLMLDDGLQLSAELGDDELRGWVLLFKGLTATIGGAGDAGRAALVEARALHRGLGVRVGEGKATAVLGLIELTSGDPVRARELVREALEIQVAASDAWSQGQCHVYLGMIAEDTGAPAQAMAHYRQAVESLRPYRDGALLPLALALQGGVVARRDARRGLRVIAAASALRARTGGEFATLFRARVECACSAAAAVLGDAARAVSADGARLGIDEAIRLAFGAAPASASAPPAGLSDREAQVAQLVADGLTNKAIASQLQLSVRTVESHVRNALAKAAVENRTQLATWARERIQ